MPTDHKIQYLNMLAAWITSHFGIDAEEANKMIEYCRIKELLDENTEYICHYNISYIGELVWNEYTSTIQN